MEFSQINLNLKKGLHWNTGQNFVDLTEIFDHNYFSTEEMVIADFKAKILHKFEEIFHLRGYDATVPPFRTQMQTSIWPNNSSA